VPDQDQLYWHATERISFGRQEFIPQQPWASAFHFNLAVGVTAVINLRLRPVDGRNITRRRDAADYLAGTAPDPELGYIEPIIKPDTTAYQITPFFGTWRFDFQEMFLPLIEDGSGSYPFAPYGEYANWQDEGGGCLIWDGSVGDVGGHALVHRMPFFLNTLEQITQTNEILKSARLPFDQTEDFTVTGSGILLPTSGGDPPEPLIASARVFLSVIPPSIDAWNGAPIVYRAGRVAFGYW
jgi:hypothetical protein